MNEVQAQVKVVYRGSDGDNAPVACACDEYGYPNKCSNENGTLDTQYENTHFRDKAEAWQHILESASIGVKWAGEAIMRARAELLRAEKQAGEAAERFAVVQEGYQNFQRHG